MASSENGSQTSGSPQSLAVVVIPLAEYERLCHELADAKSRLESIRKAEEKVAADYEQELKERAERRKKLFPPRGKRA